MGSEASISGRFPVKQAIINENTIASNEIVAAVASKSIRVIAIMFTVGAAANLTWLSAANPLTGAMEFADSGGLTHESELGIFWTNPGEALNLQSDSVAQISGVLTYILE